MAMAVLALAAWDVLQQIRYCLGIIKLPKQPRQVQSQLLWLAYFTNYTANVNEFLSHTYIS